MPVTITRLLEFSGNTFQHLPEPPRPFGAAAGERDLIRARTGEGRERAKARGVKMGRKPKLTPHQRREASNRRDQGKAVREIARSFNVHNSTISLLSV
jgi:DNA invertase Pin-like site-specific DNA recombinase